VHTNVSLKPPGFLKYHSSSAFPTKILYIFLVQHIPNGMAQSVQWLRYRLDDRGTTVRLPVKQTHFLLPSVQKVSGAHPASLCIGHRGQNGRVVTLTSHLYLQPHSSIRLYSALLTSETTLPLQLNNRRYKKRRTAHSFNHPWITVRSQFEELQE